MPILCGTDFEKLREQHCKKKGFKNVNRFGGLVVRTLRCGVVSAIPLVK